MVLNCGIHYANRQALDLADPKNLATAILTFMPEKEAFRVGP
jgi:hypothetical protein